MFNVAESPSNGDLQAGRARAELPHDRVRGSIHQHILDLVAQATGQRQVILTPRLFVDMLDRDHNAALLLSRIIYWSERSSSPHGWFYKTYAEWYTETGFSEYQVRRALHGDPRVKHPRTTLCDVGVDVQIKRAPSGSPTVHYRLNQPVFFAFLVDYLEQVYGARIGHEPDEMNGQADSPTDNESQADNVGIANSTLSAMETLHCAVSSSEQKADQKDKRIRDDFLIFANYESRFGTPDEPTTDLLMAETQRLGVSLTQEVLRRCASNGARTWHYVLKALKNQHISPATPSASTSMEEPSVEEREIDPETDAPSERMRQLRERVLRSKPPTVIPTDRVHLPWSSEWYGRKVTVNEMWGAVFTQLEAQVDRASFDAWLRSAVLVDFDPDRAEFTIAVNNRPARDWCQQRLNRLLCRLLSALYEGDVIVTFTIKADWAAKQLKDSENAAHQAAAV